MFLKYLTARICFVSLLFYYFPNLLHFIETRANLFPIESTFLLYGQYFIRVVVINGRLVASSSYVRTLRTVKCQTLSSVFLYPKSNKTKMDKDEEQNKLHKMVMDAFVYILFAQIRVANDTESDFHIIGRGNISNK